MADGEPSLAELVRRIDRFETEMRTSIARIEGRLDARVMSVDVYQAEKLASQIQLGNMERRVGVLEDAKTATFRLLMGAFVGMVLNGIGVLIVYAIKT